MLWLRHPLNTSPRAASTGSHLSVRSTRGFQTLKARNCLTFFEPFAETAAFLAALLNKPDGPISPLLSIRQAFFRHDSTISPMRFKQPLVPVLLRTSKIRLHFDLLPIHS